MKMKRRNAGFTAFELLCVIVIIAIPVLIVGVGISASMGNFWVTEDSALRAVQVSDPSMIEVVTLERHIWGYSKVIAQDGEGNRGEFDIDACILQNRTATLVAGS